MRKGFTTEKNNNANKRGNTIKIMTH